MVPNCSVVSVRPVRFYCVDPQCELAVDAVHKRSNGDDGGGVEGGGGGTQSSMPKIEDITDTMIFSPTDLVTMTCRDVDLSFAVRGNERECWCLW